MTEVFQKYFERVGIAFGTIDILCLGRTPCESVFGSIVQAALSVDSTLAHFIVVGAPGVDEAVPTRDRYAVAIRSALSSFGWTSQDVEAKVSRHFSFLDALHWGLNSLQQLVQSVPSRSIVFIEDAVEYGPSVEVEDNRYLKLSEDSWVPKMTALARAAQQRADARDALIILNARKLKPTQGYLVQQLQSIPACGFIGLELPDQPEEVLASRFAEWEQWLRSGRVGAVIKEIDALHGWTAQERTFLKAQMLHRTGLSFQALSMVEAEMPLDACPDSDVLLKFAQIADRAGSPALRRKYLERVASLPATRQALETALDLSDKSDDGKTANVIAARLEKLHPDSLRARLYRASLLS